MGPQPITRKFIALLRGINVGGHHKVSMGQLRQVLEEMGLQNVETLLNSGNVIFEAKISIVQQLQERLEKRLQETFGFSIPVILVSGDNIKELYNSQLFDGVTVSKDKRLYISFLKMTPVREPELPWTSSDRSFNIFARKGKVVLSVLDISGAKTTEAMKTLERFFGKDITTRNFNTIERIVKKL